MVSTRLYILVPISLAVFMVASVAALPSWSQTTHSSAGADSTAIATFRSLPEDELETRREQAERLSERAANAHNGLERVALLADAVAADPANTWHWLALSETQLAMGYNAEAEAALVSARATIDFLRGNERRAAVRDYSLVRAWWYFNLGRWREGLDWGRRAVKYDAGLAGTLVVGLNSAQIHKTIGDVSKECQAFRPLDSGGNRRANLSWCYLLHFYFHDHEFNGMEAAEWLDRSTHHREQDTWRWRDYGLYCEGAGARPLAIGYYRKSFRSLDIREGGWITAKERVIPTTDAPLDPMPFWTNAEGGYVTGSMLAYLGQVHDDLLAARSAAERAILAEQILAAYGRTIRRYPNCPWPILWRAEALMILEQLKDAAVEVRYARDAFRLLNHDEPALNRVQGHLLLLQKKQGQAEPLVRQAVVDFPELAGCWADLGLIEVLHGRSAEARQAFDRAIELDPSLAVAWYNRGLLNLTEGNTQDALSDVQRAAELVPDNEQVRQDLARIHQLATPKK